VGSVGGVSKRETECVCVCVFVYRLRIEEKEWLWNAVIRFEPLGLSLLYGKESEEKPVTEKDEEFYREGQSPYSVVQTV
jgi:hypothetical protein